ncbi:MAG TPA: hypothetical protein PLQ78_11395, partial [Flavipsychrobacter sp.]|nr:hypothetical protein [Flavipsychrobacter sp.]
MPFTVTRYLLFLLIAALPYGLVAQNTSNNTTSTDKSKWVTSTYNKLSLEEKIGQLFMVAAY